MRWDGMGLGWDRKWCECGGDAARGKERLAGGRGGRESGVVTGWWPVGQGQEQQEQQQQQQETRAIAAVGPKEIALMKLPCQSQARHIDWPGAADSPPA
jgi:hypothetical protein